MKSLIWKLLRKIVPFAGVAAVWLSLLAPLPAQDMPLSTVLIDGEGWQLVAEGYKFTEGPAIDKDGTVYFVDVPESVILKIGGDGKAVVWAKETGKASGLMFGPEGRTRSEGTRSVGTRQVLLDLRHARRAQEHVT